MKNVILIDPECRLIEKICQIEGLNIILALVTDYNFSKLNLNSDILKKVYFYRKQDNEKGFYSLIKNNKLEITYEEIEKYRHLQLEIEHFFSRTIADISSIQNLYFHSLSFWLNVFKTHKIDSVISTSLYHGDLEDMALSIAKSFNIATFTIECFSTVNNYIFYGIFDWKNKWYVPIDSTIKVENRASQDNVQFTPSKIVFSPKRHKSILYRFLEYIGGYMAVLITKKILMKDDVEALGFKIPFFSYFSSYLLNRKLLRVYRKLSTNVTDQKKYIYFSMHFDPEAVTQTRACISSQLTLIQMLSDSVPDDIFIYVKDHPAYTMLNSMEYSYHLPGLRNSRSVEYYDQISKMKNVKLIKIEESSEILSKNSLAVCSINGTIIIENISKYKKPIIMFDSNLSPIGKVKDIFKIKSNKDCIEALRKIVNGYKPEYNDFGEVLNKYTFKCKYDAKEFFSTDELIDLFKELKIVDSK
ncbi:hypothetical protein MEO40_25295 [Dolichospermum sp. ST_sed1]|nr:hypothetical protein [Dolichospermum sp. ST_sed1]